MMCSRGVNDFPDRHRAGNRSFICFLPGSALEGIATSKKRNNNHLRAQSRISIRISPYIYETGS